MPKEIERKFLVCNDGWRQGAGPVLCRQGYLPSPKGCTIRVRQMGEQAYITIKGRTEGITRSEYEYEIPVSDAQEMFETLCRKPLIEKNRYFVCYAGMEWEVDEFLGGNAGLIVAEVELESETQPVELPDWVGPEVSFDPRYRNASLAKHPYTSWTANKP